MSNTLNLPSEETMLSILAEMKNTNLCLAAIANQAEQKVRSWANIQLLVDMNLHTRIPIGTQYGAERETAVTIGIGDSTGITAATVDEDAFVAAVGEAHEGVYEATFDGAVWKREDGTPILLADYGITVTGTPAEGDHVIVTETAKTIWLDVADYDGDCADNEHSVVLLMHDIITNGTIPFSAPQLLYWCETALPAGKYRVTLSHGGYAGATGQDGTYCFETTQEIPAGGGIRHSTMGVSQSNGYNKSQITGGTFSTYGVQPQRASIETGLVCTEWDGTDESYVDLGTFAGTYNRVAYSYMSDFTHCNFTDRNAYGSNRYAHSCMRKWLNSDGKAVKTGDTTFSYWWTPSNNFDMPPAEAARKMAGCLHGLDPKLREAIGTATVKVDLPTADVVDTTTFEILHDKVFAPSKTELYGGNNINNAEGKLYALYDGAGNSAKIKTYNGTAQYWWTRSASPGLPNARIVLPSGALGNYNPRYASGFVGGLIIKSKIPT